MGIMTTQSPSPASPQSTPGSATTTAASTSADSAHLPRYTSSSVRAQIRAIMTAFGATDSVVDIATDVMHDTDLSGIDSHGISMLPYYGAGIRDGSLAAGTEPEVVRDIGATVVIDGKRGFGHPSGQLGMEQAIAKARTFGVGMATVRETNHYGAAGYYARLAAEQGLVGMSLCSTRNAYQTPTGARNPLMGTNPIAFACPVDGEEPIVVDMATTVVPFNKVKVYELKDQPLPADWVLDSHGRSVRNSAEAMAGLGAKDGSHGLLPLGGAGVLGGGHKGYALATMVQLLSAGISGADQPGNVDGFQSVGYFFLAIDPEVAGPGITPAYAKELRDTLRGMDPVDPEVPVQVAGDPEHRERAHRAVHGIPLSDMLLDQIRATCADFGADLVLEKVT